MIHKFNASIYKKVLLMLNIAQSFYQASGMSIYETKIMVKAQYVNYLPCICFRPVWSILNSKD